MSHATSKSDSSSNLDEAVCISYSANTLRRCIEPTILSPATGKIVGQTGFFSFGMATSLEEEKHWFQTCLTQQKK